MNYHWFQNPAVADGVATMEDVRVITPQNPIHLWQM